MHISIFPLVDIIKKKHKYSTNTRRTGSFELNVKINGISRLFNCVLLFKEKQKKNYVIGFCLNVEFKTNHLVGCLQFETNYGNRFDCHSSANFLLIFHCHFNYFVLRIASSKNSVIIQMNDKFYDIG